jgi:hypothetical protein
MPRSEPIERADFRTRRYEPFKVSAIGAAVLVVALAIGAVAIHGALWDWLRHLPGPAHVDGATRWNPAADADAGSSSQTPARLQLAPRQDWAAYRAAQESDLNSASWVDRERGVVKAPIAIAMQRIVERGLPHWSTNKSVSPLELQRQRATNDAKGHP